MTQMVHFSKYNGAGNDFIIVDCARENFHPSPAQIAKLCAWHTGIGADGLILLSRMDGNTVKMEFFNCDGSEAEMCGNGLRCCAAFSYKNGLADGKRMYFSTALSELYAEVLDEGRVRIQIAQNEPFVPYTVSESPCGPLTVYKGVTGVPHAVVVLKKDDVFPDVFEVGRFLRYHPLFQPKGTNVDFVRITGENTAEIRTYERGVEAETLACGTGCAGTAIVLHNFFKFPENVELTCHGGDLISVDVYPSDLGNSAVYLTGPAQEVFTGTFDVSDF